MGLFQCQVCGKWFDRKGNGVYCPGLHYRPCPICGEPVTYRSPAEPVRCCSKECRKKMTSQTFASKKKKCKECGKEFIPKNGFQVYCEGDKKWQSRSVNIVVKNLMQEVQWSTVKVLIMLHVKYVVKSLK